MHAIGLFLDARLEGEVSQPEALIIMHLADRSSTTINELHHAFLHRRSTLTSVLDRMEEKGLVKRVPAEADRRSVTVSLTARGKRIAGAIAEALTELGRTVESSRAIDAADVACLRAVAEAASR